MVPSAGLNDLEDRKIAYPLPGFQPYFSVFYPLFSHYTNSVIPLFFCTLLLLDLAENLECDVGFECVLVEVITGNIS